MSVRSRVKPARCAAASAALEPDVPLPKGKGTARACGRRSRALPRLRESVNREFNIMTNKSSIHFAKCRPGAAPERHNARQYSNDDFRPSYFLDPADQEPNTVHDLLDPENANAAKAADNAKAYFDQVKSHYTGRGKRAKYDNCRREAILNLSESSTEDDVKAVVKYLKDRWNLTCTSYAIHRDEGYKDQDGVHRNLHAHLVLETLYVDQSGKPKQAWSKIGRAELHQIQDDIARLMHMERTQTQGKPRKHLTRDSYVQVKAAQDRAAQETKQAAKTKAEAAKQATETARQRAQVQHDIETHKLQPSGIFVNRALREANEAQAQQIDKLHQQIKDAEFRHSREIGKKDSEIQEAAHTYNDQRQTIRQLRQQIQEQQQTIQQQQDEITATRAAALMYAELQEYWQTKIPDQDLKASHVGAFAIIQKAIHKINETLKAAGVNLMQKIMSGIQEELHPEAKAARAEREAAERRQAEEARRKSQSRGYGR